MCEWKHRRMKMCGCVRRRCSSAKVVEMLGVRLRQPVARARLARMALLRGRISRSASAAAGDATLYQIDSQEQLEAISAQLKRKNLRRKRQCRFPEMPVERGGGDYCDLRDMSPRHVQQVNSHLKNGVAPGPLCEANEVRRLLFH